MAGAMLALLGGKAKSGQNHPTIFTAIRQLIERVELVPEDGELIIKLCDELATLLKLSMEPKRDQPLAESEGVKITMITGGGFVQKPTISFWV
tara:strand:+ start:5 stop:283 length:279 start_codon:yes stop_codon:yes gene_type:complete